MAKIKWLTLAACLLVFLLAGQCFGYELVTDEQVKEWNVARADVMITRALGVLLGMMLGALLTLILGIKRYWVPLFSAGVVLVSILLINQLFGRFEGLVQWVAILLAAQCWGTG